MPPVSSDPFLIVETKLVMMLDCFEGKRIELGPASHSAWVEHVSSIIKDVRQMQLNNNN